MGLVSHTAQEKSFPPSWNLKWKLNEKELEVDILSKQADTGRVFYWMLCLTIWVMLAGPVTRDMDTTSTRHLFIASVCVEKCVCNKRGSNSVRPCWRHNEGQSVMGSVTASCHSKPLNHSFDQTLCPSSIFLHPSSYSTLFSWLLWVQWTFHVSHLLLHFYCTHTCYKSTRVCDGVQL